MYFIITKTSQLKNNCLNFELFQKKKENIFADAEFMAQKEFYEKIKFKN